MGGLYGEIDSRADFERLLEEARTITRRMLKVQPDNPVIETIDTQLDAMARWTANGAEPTPADRETIRVGLIAVRELDADRQDESGELARKLCALDNYSRSGPPTTRRRMQRARTTGHGSDFDGRAGKQPPPPPLAS